MRVLGRQLDMEVSDLEQLKGGDVLCLIQEDKPISLGIDLMQDIGIRVVNCGRENSLETNFLFTVLASVVVG